MEIDIGDIDWDTLFKQKQALVRLKSPHRANVTKQDKEHIAGIVHLLDRIQDEAAKWLGEENVFPDHSEGK